MTKYKATENLEIKVSAAPDKPVVGVSNQQRALQKMLKIDTGDILPGTRAERDLLGDSFSMMYNRKPHVMPTEEVHKSRRANRAIAEWAVEDELDNNASAGSIIASMAGAQKFWKTLLESERVKDAMDRQEKAEKAQDKAEDLLQEAGQAIQNGDITAGDALIEQANRQEMIADTFGEAATKDISQLKEHTLAKRVMNAAKESAEEESEKVNGIVKGWGIGSDGVVSALDFDLIQSLADNEVFVQLSRLLGRVEKMSMDVISDEKRDYLGCKYEHNLTKRADKLAFSERTYLSPAAHIIIRADKIQSLLLGSGLFGLRQKSQGSKAGAFVAAIDVSGSMSDYEVQVAKAIALGCARAAEKSSNRDRVFELFDFEWEVHPGVTSEDDWKTIIEWTQAREMGGTSFDNALNNAMDIVERMKAECEVGGVDIRQGCPRH